MRNRAARTVVDESARVGDARNGARLGLNAADHPCYSARLARTFLQALAQFEDFRALAEIRDLDPDARIPIAVAHEMLEAAVTWTGDANLGLKAGRLMSLGDGGALDYAVSSTATVGDSIEIAARYSSLLNDALAVRLETEANRAIVRFESHVVLPSVAEDFMLSAFYFSHLRASLAEASEIECWVKHAAPEDPSEYALTFGPATLRFSAPHSGFIFDKARLNAPLGSADSKLHFIMCAHLEQMLAKLPKAKSLTQKVRVLVANELPRRQPNAAGVARQLRVSPRTLGRRLEDEGTTFRSLVDDLRRGLALQHLSGSHVAVAEVTFLLGFSEVAAFHRAFKRWTGLTPIEYRRALQG
jgi:AraC-like DNA-binding protein